MVLPTNEIKVLLMANVHGGNLHYPDTEDINSVLSRTEKGHGIFFLKGHFAHRIYQKEHIDKIG
jgi:hypothetical protein